MLGWLMGNLCDKSDREASAGVAVELPDNAGTHATAVNGTQQQLVHSGAVNCLVRVSNVFLLSGCKDGNLAVVDCAKRVLVARISGAHDREITAVAADQTSNEHPQSAILCASSSRDKSLRLWRFDCLENGDKALQNAGCFPDAHELVVSAVDFNSQDGNQLVTGSRDNTVKLWDASSQQQIGSAMVSRNLVTHIKWVTNSHQFLQSGEDKELKLWDSRTLKVVGTFPRKQYIQTCCDVRPDGLQCVSSSNGFGGNGCEATVWDMRARKPLVELIGHAESVLAVRYYGADSVFTGSADASVRQWDPACTGRELVASLPLDGAGPIGAVCALPEIFGPGSGLVGAATFNTGVCLCRVEADRLTMSHRY